eukprot:4063554-Prymnesium_polylepis.1
MLPLRQLRPRAPQPRASQSLPWPAVRDGMGEGSRSPQACRHRNVAGGRALQPGESAHLLKYALLLRERRLAEAERVGARACLLRERRLRSAQRCLSLAQRRGIDCGRLVGVVDGWLPAARARTPAGSFCSRRNPAQFRLALWLLRLLLAQDGPHGLLVLTQFGNAPAGAAVRQLSARPDRWQRLQPTPSLHSSSARASKRGLSK